MKVLLRLPPTLTLVEGGGETTSPRNNHLKLVEATAEFREWAREWREFLTPLAADPETAFRALYGKMSTPPNE